MLAAFTSGMKNVSMNFEDEVVHYKGLAFPFESLGLSAEGDYSGFNLTYNVKGTYDTPSGKFSQIYGNVVLVDCDYIVGKIISALLTEAYYEKQLGNLTEVQYLEIKELLEDISEYAREYDISFCRFAFQLIGVLED